MTGLAPYKLIQANGWNYGVNVVGIIKIKYLNILLVPI